VLARVAAAEVLAGIGRLDAIFVGGLDELPPEKQRDTASVLRRLAINGRFSHFEETTRDIRESLARIGRWGLATYTTSLPAPWTGVVLTDAGRALLSGTFTQQQKEE